MVKAIWFLVLGGLIALGLIALGLYLRFMEKRDESSLPPKGTRLSTLALRAEARRAELQPMPEEKSGLDDQRPRARVRDGHGRVIPWPHGVDFADDDPLFRAQVELADRLIALREEAQRKGMH